MYVSIESLIYTNVDFLNCLYNVFFTVVCCISDNTLSKYKTCQILL